MTLTITADIPTGNSKTKAFYALKNTKVTLITDRHYPVLIVEQKGERFPVREELTDYKKKKQ